MSRREFSKPQRFAIIKRASNEKGQICCEGCSLVLGPKPWQIDHTIPEALFSIKTRPLTTADGKLLGVACCHAPKTVVDKGDIAKCVRLEEKRLGMKRTGGFRKPPPGYDPWRRRMKEKVT